MIYWLAKNNGVKNLHILSLDLQSFRCFKKIHIDLDSKFIIINGPNGTGKTSILEALHYGCYLRSFKTHITKELINLESDKFSISLNIASDYAFDTLQILFDQDKRTVKLNQKPINSFKELYNTFKVITISSDDLDIIQGSPLTRRSFIDQMILFIDTSYATILRKYLKIIQNRNAILANYQNKDHESYLLWTDQMLDASKLIEKKRIEMLDILNQEIKEIINTFSLDYEPLISYVYAKPYTKISELNAATEVIDKYPNLQQNELKQQRTLFGAHLADFKIEFQNKSSRIYASRGQQKLILFLLKLSQLSYLNKLSQNKNIILLIDDFFTDFDESKHDFLINLAQSFAAQTILTAPINKQTLEEKFKNYNPQIITIKD